MRTYIKLVVSLLFVSLQSFAAIEVQGHRGARSVRSENTLAAFKYALQVGVDTLELDLAVTKDNILVVSHDPILSSSICRTNSGKSLTEEKVIHHLTYSELQNYNCASVVNPRFPKQKIIGKQKIPRLEEVFDLVKNSKHPVAKKVQFNIETKLSPGFSTNTPSPKKFSQLVVDMVEKYGWEKRVIIQSFDHRTLQQVKKINKKIRTAALIEGTYILNWVEMAQAIPADIVSPNLYWITKTAIKDLHKHNIKVIPWTANTKKEWDRLIALGVDGIISDDPEALIQYLKKKNLR